MTTTIESDIIYTMITIDDIKRLNFKLKIRLEEYQMQKIPVRMLQQIMQRTIGLTYLKNFVQL